MIRFEETDSTDVNLSLTVSRPIYTGRTAFQQVEVLQAGPVTMAYPVLGSVNLAALGLTLAATVAIFAAKQPVLRVIAACAVAGVGIHLVSAV